MAARLVLTRAFQGRGSNALGWGPTVGWSLLSRVLGLCMSMCSDGQSLIAFTLTWNSSRIALELKALRQMASLSKVSGFICIRI